MDFRPYQMQVFLCLLQYYVIQLGYLLYFHHDYQGYALKQLHFQLV